MTFMICIYIWTITMQNAQVHKKADDHANFASDDNDDKSKKYGTAYANMMMIHFRN